MAEGGRQKQAHHEPDTLEQMIENDGQRRKGRRNPDPNKEHQKKHSVKNQENTARNNYKQSDYEDKPKNKMTEDDAKTRKAQDKNDEENFLRDNDEQPDKEDEAMRETQTQAITARSEKKEDHITKQQPTDDRQQEHACHEPDTLGRANGKMTDSAITAEKHRA